MSAKTYKSSLDDILSAEKKARETLEKAYKDKKEYILSEREKTEKELDQYRQEERAKLDIEIKQLTSTQKADEEVQRIHTSDIARIKEEFTQNKAQTVKFLLETILSVDLTVPDVVIGKFADKVLGKIK